MEHFDEKYHQFLNQKSDANTEWSEEDRDMREFLEQSAMLKPNGFKSSKEALWQSISDEIDHETKVATKTINWSRIISVAAAVALLVIAGISIINQQSSPLDYATYSVGEQSLQTIQLPDGSVASLNAVSELSFMEEDGQWDRTLDLKGEAFFEVKKGETFTVNTELGTVTVLGTSFNVSTRDEVFSVSCKTGRVEVRFADANRPAEILTKGQAVTFEKDQVQRTLVTADKIGQWYQGTFYYEGRPVAEAFNEIERQYDVDLKYQDKTIAHRLYEGYFFKEDLDTSLSMICDAMGLSYTVSGRVVTIESNTK
ncbi:MAG: FecR domain-containing protein [Bacteroidota bacterium]